MIAAISSAAAAAAAAAEPRTNDLLMTVTFVSRYRMLPCLSVIVSKANRPQLLATKRF